ncbi:PucR family transcriptional regulator [Mycobacterium shimoidei]|uniref:PucR family transcriptional regulator n=1 Tax=Mycobacterium shimoidei TaxID=29313 RepID=A0A1E3TF50_MYCSH|nr:helix-turn-helix domain-containing protein [Mycobacterium shimoidei]MCV7259165.1 helix-turn-helix domain-containing protein [Mycobacterium shimoidei]ODR13036.1 PucR family transcriptional regulator [Mycobacterium shimoidei]ORW83362.1 PucR family transcriptional regulator [Mycobacterium shimoidei]SRX95069.1 hypothetical protein [Amycolicicoccus subflavus DQS3-9A1] [Mycobacterium shimoidei]
MAASPGANAATAHAAAAVVDRLGAGLADLTRDVQRVLLDEIVELSGDGQLVDLLRDTVEANIETVFSAIRHEIPIERLKPPTAALEHARRLAQRGISVNALVRAYRLGHKVVLAAAREQIRGVGLGLDQSLDVDSQISDVTFTYIDWISQRVVETYQDEYDRWLSNRNNLRTLRVREILAGGDIDTAAMSSAIAYPLNGTHVAIILWCPEIGGGDELVAMERFVQGFARSIGASGETLFIPVDRVTGWAWIPLSRAGAASVIDELRAFTARRPDSPRLAVGDPHAGLEGFRRSHQQACDARGVAIALNSNHHHLVTAADPGVAMVGLLAADKDAAAEWAAQVLGPLASPTENDERLRNTLRVFLRTGSSFKAAAEELTMHANSVKYRVARAIERRGRPVTDDRLDVEVALLFCQWYGPRAPA